MIYIPVRNLRAATLFILLPDDGFQPACKLASWQHYTPLTTQAFQTDIRTQSNDLPLITTARVWLSQTHDIIQIEFRQHGGIISWGRLRIPWFEFTHSLLPFFTRMLLVVWGN
jgi:hypothetical protein